MCVSVRGGVYKIMNCLAMETIRKLTGFQIYYRNPMTDGGSYFWWIGISNRLIDVTDDALCRQSARV